MSTQFKMHYLPLALLSLTLLPAASSHAAGETTRVSVDSEGEQGNNESKGPAISADGRYVAFQSGANNLVEGPTPGGGIFVHDRTTGATSRVSVNSNGEQANDNSFGPSISADGRYVSFTSYASNLVPEDANGSNFTDVFVHDRTTHITTRVSVSSKGEQGNDNSANPSISVDGRFVAFYSDASNLVPEDTNGQDFQGSDIFVHDRLTGKTSRVNVDSMGREGNANLETSPSISADGRYVAFESLASNLVPGDTNGEIDIFVRDRVTATTSLVSVNSAGQQANGGSSLSGAFSISADGRYVAFNSEASNLVPGDTNQARDVFVHDRQTHETTRVSVNSAGMGGNNISQNPSISADGRYVAFWSFANNLVKGDHNDTTDIFVRDRLFGKTTLVSVDSVGQQSNNFSAFPAISADGRYVAFESGGSNLVPGDTNEVTDIFVRDRWLNTTQSADLQVVITSQPDSVQNGDVGRYLFTITNNAPDNIDAVRLIDSVSGGKVWSLTPSQGYCSEAAVSVCRLHKLAAGESATVRTVFKAKGNPLIQNLTVSAAPADSDPGNNRVTVSTPVTP